jgi:predicted transcriptional regulator
VAGSTSSPPLSRNSGGTRELQRLPARDGWEYRFDLGPDPLTGKRRVATRRGFPTRKEAAAALRTAMSAAEKGRHVKASRQTIAEFLDEWLTAIQGRIRPTTWTNYRDYRDAYVNPVIGGTTLQDLTPVRINLLYSHLLTQGRVRKATGTSPGLAPKTVRNVHVMLRRALRDAVKWGYIPRNPAEDAEPPGGTRPQAEGMDRRAAAEVRRPRAR